MLAEGRRAGLEQFRPDHRDLFGRLDPEPDLVALEPDDGHADVVPDVELLHQLTSQHQHVVRPRISHDPDFLPTPDMPSSLRSLGGVSKTTLGVTRGRAIPCLLSLTPAATAPRDIDGEGFFPAVANRGRAGHSSRLPGWSWDLPPRRSAAPAHGVRHRAGPVRRQIG